MRVRDSDPERSRLFERGVGEESGVLATAEERIFTALNELVDKGRQPTTVPPGKRPSGPPGGPPPDQPQSGRAASSPRRDAVAVIARLLVHLLRMNAASTQRITLFKVDALILLATALAVIYLLGWLGTNDVGSLSAGPGVLVGGTLIVFLGRTAVIVVQVVCYRRAIRLRILARRHAAWYAIRDRLQQDERRLEDLHRKAKNLDDPTLVRSLAAELRAIGRLRADVSTLAHKDLAWALEAEFDSPVHVPAARYRLRMVAAWLRLANDALLRAGERVTGLPLTRQTAMRVATDNYARRLSALTDALNDPLDRPSLGQAAQGLR